MLSYSTFGNILYQSKGFWCENLIKNSHQVLDFALKSSLYICIYLSFGTTKIYGAMCS